MKVLARCYQKTSYRQLPDSGMCLRKLVFTGSGRIPGCVSGNKCLPAVAGFRDVSPELSPERFKEMWVMNFVNDQL
jgi:hypothetical protein